MVNEENGGTSRLATDKVKVRPLYYSGKIFKTVLIGLIAIAAVLVMVYSLVLVPTSMRYVNTDAFGLQLTKDPTIKRGGIPAGQVELVTIGNDRGYLSSVGAKMSTAFSPHKNVSSMAILAGPDGRLLTNKKGEMVVNGVPIKGSTMPVNYQILKDKKWYLSNQYIALCLNGDCESGKPYIISEGAILGEAKAAIGDRFKTIVNEAVTAQETMFEKAGKPLNEASKTGPESGTYETTNNGVAQD